MSFDWFAHEWTKADSASFTDCFARIKLLAKDNDDEAKEKHKELVYGKFKVKRGEPQIKPVFKKGVIDKGLNFLKGLSIQKPSVNLSTLPSFSFFLQFTFKLDTPYLSKDDEEFYICENPVRKDKVFKVPMVSGNTWKGNMRWVARHIEGLDNKEPDSKEIIDLFGNEKDEDKKFKSGRLNFYPTFFDQIGLEVINPHDRKTKAGIQPIYIESVPEGATGIFSLLYVPFDLMGKKEEIVRHEVIKDLRIINESLEQMMLTYGFSAKKSSGFGIVKDGFTPQGVLDIKLEDVERCHFNNFSGLRNTFNEIIPMLEGKGD